MPLTDHWAEVLYKVWDGSHDSCIQYVPSFHLPSSLLIITSSPSQKQVRIQLNDDPEQQVGAPVRPAPSPTPAQQPPSTHNHLLHGLIITDETRTHLALESCSSSHTRTSNVWLVGDWWHWWSVGACRGMARCGWCVSVLTFSGYIFFTPIE